MTRQKIFLLVLAHEKLIQCPLKVQGFRSPFARHLLKLENVILRNYGDRRISRYKDFSFFLYRAEENFLQIANEDPRHPERESLFSFYAIDGGRNGRIDKRLFDVFYGSRPIQFVIEKDMSESFPPSTTSKFVTEGGAQLSYQQFDNGKIGCFLSPARSSNIVPFESQVVLDLALDPRKLNEPTVLRRHWRQFSSYMEVTSIDGNPTWSDKMQVWWLRSTRILIVNKEAQPTKLWSGFKSVIKFAFTVGLSGFMLFGVQELFGK